MLHDYKKVDIEQLEADNVYFTTQMTKVAIDKIKSTNEPFFMYKGTVNIIWQNIKIWKSRKIMETPWFC